MTGVLGRRSRGIAFAALVVGLVFAITTMIGGGLVGGAIELAWIAYAGKLALDGRRRAFKAMFFGALLLFVLGCVGAFVDLLGSFDFPDCNGDCHEADARLAHVWAPFVLATVSVGVGAMIAMVASVAEREPLDAQVPPARVTSA
jgi:MFS family permease